jgi:hypothetical protein
MLIVLMLEENNKISYQEEPAQIPLNATVQIVKMEIV